MRGAAEKRAERESPVHEDLGKERRHPIKDHGTEIIRHVTAEGPAESFSRRNENSPKRIIVRGTSAPNSIVSPEGK